MTPLSREWTPVRTLISVDLPAPFWPTRAWTSPRPTRSDASRSATTPGKLLLIRSIARRGGTSSMNQLNRVAKWEADGRRSPIRPLTRLGSVRRRQLLRRVGLVVELVRIDDLALD